MATKIRISEVVYVDLRHTPKSLVDKAVATARQQHAGAAISIEYVPEIDTDTSGSSGQGGHIEISKTLFTKRVASEDWEEPVGNATILVRDAKQTFVRKLKALQELTDILKDVYGLEPTEGGD